VRPPTPHKLQQRADAHLFDFAAFQSCFEVSPISGTCLVFDFNADGAVDLLDFAGFSKSLKVP
jgi:hypothetical protein